MGVNKYNAEGYYDPTSYQAMTKVMKEEKAKSAFLPLAYICSPYAGEVSRNVENARKYCRFAYEQNTIPIASHLLFPQFMNDDNPIEREMAMHFNYVLLGKCDELWVFGSTVSAGMAHEIDIAKKRRQKIRYFTEKCEEVME